MKYTFTNLPKPRLNPYYEEVKLKTQEWAEKMGLLTVDKKKRQKLLDSDFPRLAALTYPTAELEHLQLFGDWMFWIFPFDDILEESEYEQANQIKQKIISIMENKDWVETNNSYLKNLYQAWADIMARWQKLANFDCQKRFKKHFREYLDSVIILAAYRRWKQFPNQEIYFAHRQHDINTNPTFDFMELTIVNIPSEVFTDEKINKLKEITTRNVFIVNDIMSVQKDRLKKEVINWVLIVEQEKELFEKEALDYAVDFLEKELAEFQDLHQEISSNPWKKAYADGLKNAISAHLEWYEYAKARYETEREENNDQQVLSIVQVEPKK